MVKFILYIKISFFLISFTNILAQDRPELSVDHIPTALLSHAEVIYRLDHGVFEIRSIGKGIYRVKKEITVLDKQAEHYADFNQGYSKLYKLHFLSGQIYDKAGHLVKKVKAKDLIDVKTTSAGTLFDDHRMMYYDCIYREYPFTVAYEYEIVLDGLLSIPSFLIQSDYAVSVEKSRFTVVVPEGMDIRYKEIRLPKPVTISSGIEGKTYAWRFDNIPALVKEPFSNFSDRYARVMIAPNDFEIEGYKGSQRTWAEFGRWNHELSQGLDDVPEETVDEIETLISSADSETEKAKIIYEYLQQKTRYIGIQLGIGGWKPFSAETVDRLSYGDCKALTNYTHALLNKVGIKSYYTLVSAGEDAVPIKEDFPSNQFNHAFLTVLADGDTIWLECTSQQVPFGYQGTFTDDRDVLLVNENGGKIIHTKVYDTLDNQMISNAYVNISLHEPSHVTIDRSFQGVFYDEARHLLNDGKEELKSTAKSTLPINNYKLIGHTVVEKRNIIPSINEHIQLETTVLTKKLGDKIVITPNLLNRENKIPKSEGERLSSFSQRRAKVWIDSVVYQIPEGYALPHIPDRVQLESPFGSYHSHVFLRGHEMVYVRRRKLLKGEFQPEDYADIYDFYAAISKNDNTKLLLVKQ